MEENSVEKEMKEFRTTVQEQFKRVQKKNEKEREKEIDEKNARCFAPF